MLFLAEITPEAWVGMGTIVLMVIGLIGAADRRRASDVSTLRKEIEEMAKALDKELQSTYLRRDVYVEQQKPMRKQLARVERMVELIYRNMRGMPPMPGLEEESDDGSG